MCGTVERARFAKYWHKFLSLYVLKQAVLIAGSLGWVLGVWVLFVVVVVVLVVLIFAEEGLLDLLKTKKKSDRVIKRIAKTTPITINSFVLLLLSRFPIASVFADATETTGCDCATAAWGPTDWGGGLNLWNGLGIHLRIYRSRRSSDLLNGLI